MTPIRAAVVTYGQLVHQTIAHIATDQAAWLEALLLKLLHMG